MALIGRGRDARRQLEDSRKKEQEGIAQLRVALTKVGWDAEDIEANKLRVMVERADAYRREQEAKAEKIAGMREAVRTAKSEVARRQGELERAEAARKSWQAEWATAVAEIDLQCDDKPEVLSAQINVIDEMREHAAAARDLRDNRIGTIERDIGILERTVAEVAAELAPDLMDGDADVSVVELDRRREEALKLHEHHLELTETVAKRRKKIEELEEGRKTGWTSVQPLLKAAGVEDAATPARRA